MPGRKDEAETCYSSVQELIGPEPELDVIHPEDNKLKRRVDALFDFCVFFVSPALAVMAVLLKPHKTPFGLAFLFQTIGFLMIILLLPFMVGFFAGAAGNWIHKRAFLIVWAHLGMLLIYAALNSKL